MEQFGEIVVTEVKHIRLYELNQGTWYLHFSSVSYISLDLNKDKRTTGPPVSLSHLNAEDMLN